MQRSETKQLETELRLLLQRAEGPYRRALALINSSVPETNATVDDITSCLQRLDPLMRQTQEIDRDLAPCRQRWLQLGIQADASLKAVFNQHQQLLGELIAMINALEARMHQLKAAAVPAMDSFVRHQQMQRAYQQSSR